MTSEEILLGQIIKTNSILHDQDFSIAENDFYDSKCKRVFRGIWDCLQRDEQVDILTLGTQLTDLVSFISSLSNVISSANWKYHHGIIVENSKKRALRALGMQLTDDLNDGTDSQGMISNIEEKLLEILERSSNGKIYDAKEMLVQKTYDYEERVKKFSEDPLWMPGYSTGFSKIDEICNGFQRDHLYYIGARPSQGKTALLVNFIVNCCRQGLKVGFLSLESSRNQIMDRIFSIAGGIPMTSLKTGALKTSFDRIIGVGGEIHEKWDLHVYDIPNASLHQVQAVSRAMKSVHDIDILFIDYIQIIKYHENIEEHRRIGKISLALKELNRKLDIPLVVAAQLTRDAEGKPPKLNQFSGSSQLEKDADNVMFIYNYENRNGNNATKIMIEKGRDDGTGAVDMEFIRETLTFRQIG